jgi:hypothetical protein
LRKGLFGRELKVLVLFSSDQKDWKATSPPITPLFSQKLFDKNQEILLSRFAPQNYVFEDSMTPPPRAIGIGL